MSSCGQRRARATSAMRSVPETCVPEVSTASAPKECAALTIRSSSVAISTSRAPAAQARSYTHCTMGLPPIGRSTLPASRAEARRAGMTTRNTRGPGIFSSTVEQRIVGGELARLFLQHHGHRVADRIGETIHAAYQHLRLALELQRPLAHRTGEYLEQACIHQI